MASSWLSWTSMLIMWTGDIFLGDLLANSKNKQRKILRVKNINNLTIKIKTFKD